MLKKALSTLAGTVIIAAPAMAQQPAPAAPAQVEATKQAPAPAALPKVYANVNLRHYEKGLYTGTSRDNVQPYNQGRFTVGAKAFSERLDTNLTFFAQRNAGTNQVSTPYAPELVSELTAVKTTNYQLIPYVDMYLPYHADPANGDFGLVNKFTADQQTVLGTLSFETFVDAYTHLVGGKDYTKVQRRPEDRGVSFSLLRQDDQGNLETHQRDLNLTTEYGAYVTLAVAKVKGLSLKAGLDHGRQYNPVYVSNPTNSTQADMKGYKTLAQTETLFDVSYQLTEALSLSNTTYHYTKGFYEAGIQASDSDPFLTKNARLVNRTMLSYTLF